MTSFIDELDYEIIASQLKNLNLNEQGYNHSHRKLIQQKHQFQQDMKEKLLHFKESLKQKYSKNRFKFINHSDINPKLTKINQQTSENSISQSDNQIQCYANEQKINPMYSLCSKLHISRDPCQIKIRTTLLKNSVPIQIKSKSFRLLISRFFTKLNSNRRDGLYKLNPFNGLIYFDLSSIISLQQFNRFIFESKSGLQYIESQLRQSSQQAKKNLFRVLQIIQQIPQDSQRFMTSYAGVPLRKIIRDERQLQLIKKCINYCTFQCEFMYNIAIRKNLSEAEIKNKIQSGKQKFDQNFNSNYTITTKTEYLKVHQIMHYYNRVPNNESFVSLPYAVYMSQLKQYEKQFIQTLIYPTARTNITNQRNNIFNQILIDPNEKIKWDLVAEGGFSKIQKGQVKYCYREFLSNPNQDLVFLTNQQINKKIQTHSIKKVIVKKSDKTIISKIHQEKRILNTLRELLSQNISKFYQSNQLQHKNFLYSDYYAFKSLDNYKKNWQEIFSLLSKLYIIMQAIQGIRFLSDNKIIHLDLKPLNILIGRNLGVRLTDFGQSYHPDVRNADYRPGYTIPFSSPQIFAEGNIAFNEKIDVFGLGILMHEILFDFFPLDIRRVSTEKLISFYRENKYEHLILSNPQKIDGFGPSAIINLLSTLCLKCLSKNTNQRPLLDWIQIILKQCILYLDQMY